MEHRFTGPAFTLGVEEELMIVDPGSMELVSAIEEMIEAIPWETEGSVKPELLQSVLEIATDVCRNAGEAAGQLEDLRRRVRETAETKGLTIGSAATHPFAMWEDQRIVQRERYEELVAALGFVVRQELLFGLHVHVGIDDADKAIHVANGMRVHLPILLALSTNSPFWRGQATSWMSSRTPLFRLLPRVGIPPRFEGWDEYCERIEFMVTAGAIPDYTYLWWDVRPHPNLGTVEIRSCDAQTRLEHTIAITALIQAMAKELCEHFDAGEALGTFPAELLEENKWLAARYGVHGELIDLPSSKRVPTAELARRLVARLRPHARELGAEAELEGILDLAKGGTGADRQLAEWRANRDMAALVRALVEATAAGIRGGSPA
ncbi:MAG TPA: carboxylate-amine ligase [Solirubrobacterales bacterium]|nr:carboxylate-amine ligase [Solirubrobacterales bacterium]